MFGKQTISNFSTYLKGFDRIFLSASVLKNNKESQDLVNALIGASLSPNSIVLNSKTVLSPAIDKTLIQRLSQSGILFPKQIPTTYLVAARELSIKKKYRMLLITNDETEGHAFVKLTYEDNQVNNIDACAFRSLFDTYSYTYNPPAVMIDFNIETELECKLVQVVFAQTSIRGTRYLYDANNYKAISKKVNSRHFVYTINKYELFDCDQIIFYIESINGTRMNSVPCEYLFNEAQNWKISVVNGRLEVKNSLKQPINPPPVFQQTTITTSNVEDENVPASEKYQYYGGNKVSLPPDKKIDITLPREGATVYTNSKKPIRLIKEIGSGGEGIVYSTDNSSVVCKIINNNIGLNLTENKRNKIELMTKAPLKNPNVIWPIDAVYNSSGVFVGFTMKSAAGLELKKMIVQRESLNGAPLVGFGIFNLTRLEIVKMIISILETMVYLHNRNIIVGDIKFENLMIQNNDPSRVFFVDCDSYQVGKYPATKMSKGFIPPEIAQANINATEVYRTFGNENYAIFSLLFQILHKGILPYAQITQSNSADLTEEEKAYRGYFPYSLDQAKTEAIAPKGYPAPNWSHLPGYIKEAFYSVGHRSGKQFGHDKRLSSKDWLRLFKQYQRDLESGRLKAIDPECNVGIHSVRSKPIAYDKLNIKMSQVVSLSTVDISLVRAISVMLSKGKIKASQSEVLAIAKALRDSAIYKEERFAFRLSRNAGVVYELDFRYKE